MADQNAIAAAIEKRIAGYGSYANWTVGISNDWARRKNEHSNDGKNVACWSCWQAVSLADAQAIERHFIYKGMKGGVGGATEANKAVFVYVF
jgi:hypothetical protein